MHVTLRDHGVADLGGRRCPACWLPAGFRYAVAKSPRHHENEVNQRHHDEGLHDAHVGRACKVLHQISSQRRADHGAAAKAHDGHAGRHAAAVWKPLDQRGNRRNIAQPQANAADHAGTQKHQPELVQVNAQGRNQHAATPAASRHHTGLTRPGALQPAAPNGRRRAQQHEKQRVHPPQGGDFPVTAGAENFSEKTNLGPALDSVFYT